MPDEPSAPPAPTARMVRYSADALKALKKHGNMAARIKKAVDEHAADPQAHANNVVQLVGSTAFRMRVSTYRVLFERTETEIIVTGIGPRGGIYGD